MFPPNTFANAPNSLPQNKPAQEMFVDEPSLKETLKSLIEIVREQHLQIQSALSSAFDVSGRI
jgi:hypothetical protein